MMDSSRMLMRRLLRLEPPGDVFKRVEGTKQQVHLMEEILDYFIAMLEFGLVLETICHNSIGDRDQAQYLRI